MALDFPSSPTTGQTFSSPGGTTWTYDGSKWGNGTLLTIPDAPSDANTYGRHAGSWNVALTGITSAQVTGALGFTPYNATNPAGYQTSAQVTAALPVASSTAPLMDGTAAVGTGTTWARADHVHPTDTSHGGTGTVTSIVFSAPLTGGTITTAGTVGLGNVPVGNLNNGTNASATTFWRGDGAWAPAVTTGGLTTNALALGTGATAIGSLASLGTTTTVLHGNAAGSPTFGAVSLTADVTGILGLANGGTNAATAGAALTSLGAAPLNSPAFTGAPSLPTGTAAVTQTAGNNTTAVATTAFVTTAVPVASSTAPLMDGTVAIGTGTTWARADHVHASDTSRAPLASPSFTGTVTAAGNITASSSIISGSTISATGTNATVAFVDRTTALQWYIFASGSSANVWNATNGSVVLVDIPGNLTITGGTATKPGGGSWVAPSDAALKAAIDPYLSGLKEVIQLEPIKYYYSGAGGMPTNEEFIGLDAAATARIMPELIGTGSWTDPDDPGGETLHYGTVDSGPLIYALVNATRELAEQNAALEARIAALETRQ